MRRILIVFVCSIGLMVASGWPDATSTAKAAAQGEATKTSGGTVKDRLAGTWRLASTERRDANGKILPPQASPAAGGSERVGYIMYDPAGYMGVVTMQAGRQKYAGAQPTPGEARAALTSYNSYFGRFTVNEAEGFVTHHLQGSLNPNMAPDQKRFFELSGNRLTLIPPRGADGVQSRITWERVPDLPKLTPTHRRLIGFYKVVSNEQRNAKGEVVSSTPYQAGFIIYTASGHMAVHLMRPDRQKYAGAQPTPEGALNAISTYGSYFGPYSVHEAERYLVHHRIGNLNPGQVGTDAQRFYEFSGRRLILRPPPTTVGGQKVQGVITWERVSADAAR
jgi:hypothetical protein